MTALDDDDITIPEPVERTQVCANCGGSVVIGGPIVPTPEAIAFAFPDLCSAGPRWAWCGRKRHYERWMPRTHEPDQR